MCARCHGRARPRGLLATVRSSVALRCAACLLLYASVLIGLYTTASMSANKKMLEAFPTVEIVGELEEALVNDRFGQLVNSVPASCDVLVFAKDGSRLFASSPGAAARVSASDLPIISSADDRRFLEVLRRQGEDGEGRYEILYCVRDEDSDARTVMASAVCSEDGTILEGSLFPGRTALTDRELSLIKGVYGEHRTIQKHEYETTDGEGRTVVVISPVVGESSFENVVKQTRAAWLFTIPFAVLATIAAAAVLVHMVRRAIAPLDQAIEARRDDAAAPAPQARVPVELAATYDNFLELMDQLEREREDKRRVIADVSHDLKTPLTVIGGYARAFEDHKVPAEKSGAYLHAIYQRSQAAIALIEDLLAYARADHPDFAPDLSPCDVHQGLRELVEGRRADVEFAGDALECDVAKTPLMVRLDWRLFSRAVDNLLTNACRHTPRGTTIRVSCAHDDGSVRVTVQDTGPGFPEELRECAFDAFVTSNVARSSGGGTGLGLAIVRSCALAHGGTARFAVAEAPFTTAIEVEVPLRPVEGAPGDAPKP